MNQNKFGEMIFAEQDVCDLLMQGRSAASLSGMTIEPTIDLETAILMLNDVPAFIRYNELADTSVEDFDHRCQQQWHMPAEFSEIDIAAHVLGLCKTDAELQRVGEELLLYQERDLFNLLRYIRYLVDVMQENNVIWGVGRGSSVSSYVLYLLGVHRINSLFYELSPAEFLR